MNFVIEMLKIVPGYVSTEIDVRLSTNTEVIINRAHRIIEMYQKAGIATERILIRIVSTWEGIEACRRLSEKGIRCEMTQVFNLNQAVACAEANATAVAVGVGKIFEWHLEQSQEKKRTIFKNRPSQDPAVIGVTKIYNYFKQFGYKTMVKGVNFLQKYHIFQLVGCDRMEISIGLLAILMKEKGSKAGIGCKLTVETANSVCDKQERVEMNEINFRTKMNEDAMATQKLNEMIRKFNGHFEKLEKFLSTKLV